MQEQGLVVVGERDVVDGINDEDYNRPKIALVTAEAAQVLQSAGEGSLGALLCNILVCHLSSWHKLLVAEHIGVDYFLVFLSYIGSSYTF